MANDSKRWQRCHISSEQAQELTHGESCMGEGFWITLKNDDIAIVENILLCGLGVGDEIRVRGGDEDFGEHPHEFVEVVKRNCKVTFMRYTFDGLKQDAKSLPKDVQSFIAKLRKHGIFFEHAMIGLAIVQYPLDMSEEDFEAHMSSGPLEYEA